MRGRPKAELVLSELEREQLKALTMRRKTAQALALRARIVLASAEGWTIRPSRQGSVSTCIRSPNGDRDSSRIAWMGCLMLRAQGRRGPSVMHRWMRLLPRRSNPVPAGATHWSTRTMLARRICRSRPWRVSGVPSGCSRIDRRPSSSPPTHFRGEGARYRGVARSRHWTARSPFCRWRQVSPSDVRTTTCAMARQRCSPRWTSPQGKLSVNCIADIAAVSSCSFYARSKPTCRPSSMCISSWTTTARTRRRRLRLGSPAIRASTFISHRPPPHGSIRLNAGLQPSPNNTSAAARIAQPDNLSKPSANTLT